MHDLHKSSSCGQISTQSTLAMRTFQTMKNGQDAIIQIGSGSRNPRQNKHDD